MTFKELLETQIKNNCSDLHLMTGEPPLFREENGDMNAPENAEIITKEKMDLIVKEIIGESGLEKLEKEKEVDFALEIPELSRFRITFFEESQGIAIAIRAIPFIIPKPDELKIPKEILDLVLRTEGLILVTGPTGSGKSTTLASLVEFINENRRVQIITIEDPIEFLF